MQFEYSVDWISATRVPKWRKHLVPRFAGKPVAAIEIGVFEGRASVWLLQNVLTHSKSTLVGIDPYVYKSRQEIETPKLDTAAEYAKKNLAQFGRRATLRIERSEVVLPTLPARSFDLIRVDGEHTLSSTLSDMFLAWRLLKRGGVLIVDDYDKARKSRHINEYGISCPRTAVNIFREYVKAQKLWIAYDVGLLKNSLHRGSI